MIPSYDDLTPGIPDVLDAETVSQLALFLRGDLKRNAPSTESSPPSSEGGTLFACLRTVNGELPTDRLRTIAQDFSPRVMRASGEEILLDVSGLGRLIGDPPAIAAALTRAIAAAGLAQTARAAIAPTQTAARLLATQAPDYPIARLPDLSVSFLRPLETLAPAINHRERARPYETFARWGIATLGDLAALPAAGLSSRLGRRGVALQRLARGLDPRPFVPDGDTPRYIGRLELEWPLDTLEPLSFVFARLLEPLSAALERADRGAAAIRLDLRLTTRDTHARVLQLPAPMRDPKVLRTLLLLDLESCPPSAAVDIVAIELDPAPARITQFSLLERAMPSPETLSTLTARLSALVGESRVGSAVLLDTHRPDGFAMTRYAPELQGANSANGAKGANGAGANDAGANGAGANGAGANGAGANGAGANGAGANGAGANGAGANGADSAVIRRQRTPPAIRVSVEHGRPVHIAAARRGMPQGAVVQAAGPWRTSGGWWTGGGLVAPKRPSGEAGSHEIGPWSRDEWDVALSSGAVCRIFQDRTTERWFLDGIYD
jgi:protein ImuB